MSFTSATANVVLVNCGRCCCICHTFCGTKIELHHIVPQGEGGSDEAENCIPLCFNCHSDVGHYNSEHPKGRKFSSTELKSHRDNWYAKVSVGNYGCSDEDLRSVDRELFAQLRTILTSNGGIAFLRHHDFAGVFHRSDLDELYSFAYWSGDPAHEFFNSNLEIGRASLLNGINICLNTVVANAHMGYDPKFELCSVPPELSYQEPARFRKIVSSIHESAEDVCRLYDSLIRTGRRELATL